MGIGPVGMLIVGGATRLFLLFFTVRDAPSGTFAYFGTLILGVIALIAQAIGLPREIVDPLWPLVRWLREWSVDALPCDPRGRC